MDRIEVCSPNVPRIPRLTREQLEYTYQVINVYSSLAKLFVSSDTYTGIIRLSHTVNLLKPTGYVMHQQFNIQQLYVLPTLYLYVLYLSENKQRLVPLTA